MARFSRLEALTVMLREGLVPLYHHSDPQVAVSVLRAVADGGGRVVEFTNRGDGAHEVFAELERVARAELTGMVLGAGSVTEAGTAALYCNLGASFIVSPAFDAEVARVCNRRKVAYLPGAATPTEIATAEEAGCEIVKVFPGGAAGGPGFVKAVLGPSPRSRLMPTGGVEPTEESLSAWFDAGVACVGIGSKLLPGDVIRQGDWADLAKRVSAARDLVARCRPALEEEWS